MTKPLLALVPLALASGCAFNDADYPSLAPRAVERLDLAEPAPEPVETVAPDPALDAALAKAEAERRSRAAAFDTAARRIEQTVRGARGAKAGSDLWLDAQVALAGLDEARSEHESAVAAMEQLAAERAETLAPPYPALEEALTAARAASAELRRRTDAIAAQLPAG